MATGANLLFGKSQTNEGLAFAMLDVKPRRRPLPAWLAVAG
jgi:hypothetical protein